MFRSVLVRILVQSLRVPLFVDPHVPKSDCFQLQLELRDKVDISSSHSITAVFTLPAVFRGRHPCLVGQKPCLTLKSRLQVLLHSLVWTRVEIYFTIK